jgi:hypothetical protein
MAEPVVFAVGADLSSLKKELSKVGPIANKTGEMAGAALKAGFAAVVGAAGATGLFAKGVLEEGAQFETLSTRLTTLMGSAEDARDRMQELANIGKTTPFELPGIVEAEASLRGFGVDAEKVLPKVLDLSAALGLELSDAAGAVGRAFAGGAGAADVLRERGVLAAIELRTGIKATNMEIGQFREELLTTLEEYEGGSARLAATLNGQVSNLKDSWGDFQRQVADAGFYDASKTAITEINRLLIENEDLVSDIAQATGMWLKGSLMFVVESTGAIATSWDKIYLGVKAVEGLTYGLDAITAEWSASLLTAAAELWGIQGDFQDGLLSDAAANERQAASSRKAMNAIKAETAPIRAEIRAIDAETEAILKRIEESGTGGTTTRKKKDGNPGEDPEVVALKERQDLIGSILQQYRDEEAEEAAQAWDDATKLREQQYKDWADAEEAAAEERLRILEETQARRMAIAEQGADATLAIARAGGSALLDEDISLGQTLKKQGLQLISDLLMQLAGYFATKAIAYAATGNIPKAAMFGAGAAIAAVGSGAMSAVASSVDTSSGSEDGETFTQGSRTEVATAEVGDTDGGLAQAADALVEAAEDLKDAARALARGSSGGSLSRTLQRQRSISGLFSSFQGA